MAPQPLAAKKEETNKREMTRDGEKDERAKKMRKDDPKENISAEKKPVYYKILYVASSGGQKV